MNSDVANTQPIMPVCCGECLECSSKARHALVDHQGRKANSWGATDCMFLGSEVGLKQQNRHRFEAQRVAGESVAAHRVDGIGIPGNLALQGLLAGLGVMNFLFHLLRVEMATRFVRAA